MLDHKVGHVDMFPLERERKRMCKRELIVDCEWGEEGSQKVGKASRSVGCCYQIWRPFACKFV